MSLESDAKDFAVGMRKGFFPFFCGGLILILLCSGLYISGLAAGWFTEAAEVGREQFGPRAIVKKYEWFKDASAQLAKKQADIKVYDARIAELKQLPRDQMTRLDREDLNQAVTERLGVVSSYNGLAAEYNSAMAKINYSFANIGEVPPGSEALPREYAPYQDH